MKVRPLHDRVLIKRIEEGETVRGGIIIPDTAKEKPQEGEVVAVGTGKRLEDGKVIPLEVKEGDLVNAHQPLAQLDDRQPPQASRLGPGFEEGRAVDVLGRRAPRHGP